MRLFVLALCLLAPGQDPPAPQVELESAFGSIQHLPLEGLELADPRDKGAVFLRFLGLPAPTEEATGLALDLRLGTGGRLAAFLEGGTEEHLELVLAGGSRCSLGVESLTSLQVPQALEGRDGLPVASDEGDRLYLVRGGGLDRLEGLTLGFSVQGILFEGPLGERLHPWAEVAALFIEPLPALEDSQSNAGSEVPTAEITTQGGGAFSAQLLGITGAGVRLRLAGEEWLLLPQDVAELAVRDSSYAFLSNLEPADLGPLNPFDSEEVMGQSWPMRSNRAVGGGPLRVGGRLFFRGLGVHAPSRVTWKLDGGWSHLRTRIGVDDSAGRGAHGGSVRFRVLVDGELRFESNELRVGNAAFVVPPIDLVGAQELLLEVDPLEDWVLDRADWLRPILLKE